jgi:hypothetical protein
LGLPVASDVASSNDLQLCVAQHGELEGPFLARKLVVHSRYFAEPTLRVHRRSRLRR